MKLYASTIPPVDHQDFPSWIEEHGYYVPLGPKLFIDLLDCKIRFRPVKEAEAEERKAK